jgi:hypothetical protein
LSGVRTTQGPGALHRGGAFYDDSPTEVFAVIGGMSWDVEGAYGIGFRCAR